MNEIFRNRFLGLKVSGQRCSIPKDVKTEKDRELIAYLQSVIQEKTAVTTFEEIGFCYWNISDNYAMLRESDYLYENHNCFFEHLVNSQTIYRFWLVCDATQKLTLETGGFSDFWWDLYMDAVGKNKDQTEYPFVEFHVHRAALCYPPQMKKNEDFLAFAKGNFIDFLEKTKGQSSNMFFETIFLSMVDIDSLAEKKLINNFECLLQYLNLVEVERELLCGEWKSFITPWTKRKQGVVGIVSIINAFIDSGKLNLAIEVYSKAREEGLPQNYYIEQRIK